MKTFRAESRTLCSFWVTVLVLSLAPLSTLATTYTWLGTSSNAWELAANWSGGTYPNNAADMAAIDLATNNPVQISTAVLLGGSASNSLTIGDNAGTTGLDIASAGSLTLTGTAAGISSNKIVTIEGLLIASYSPGGHNPPMRVYPISGTGSIALRGGTIDGTGTRSYWNLNLPLTGYGMLSNKVYVSSTVTVADGATITFTGGGVSLQGGTLTANGSGYYTNLGAISGYGTIAAPFNPGGTIGNSGGVTIIAADISGGGRIGHETETDLGGITLTGTNGTHINFDNDSGPVNLTGDLVFRGYVDIGSNGAFNLNGHKITLTYDPNNNPPVLGIISAVAIGTGTIDNATSADLDFSQGPYNLAGGLLTSTGGGAFIRGGIYGWGTITAPLIPLGSAAIVNANSSGHTLHILNSVLMTNNIINGNLIASSGGILELGPGSVLTTTGPANFTGYVSPGSGVVNLNGTNIVGGTSPIKLNAGPLNVTGDSTVGGPIDCAASLTINSGTQLSISGGTATVSLSAGALTNNGTLAVGAGLLTNATASAYSLGGAGRVTLAGGSLAGTHGFSGTNTLEGYGEISAPYANSGTIDANANGSPLFVSGGGVGTLVNAPTGIMEATGGGTLSFSTATDLANQGTLIAAANSTVQVQGGPLDVGTGTLSGSGTIVGSVSNAAGTVAPGASPGTLTIAGSYTQTGGTLLIELGGAAPGQFDVLAVSGNANLGGALRVATANNFNPAPGQNFAILTAGAVSGAFSQSFGPPGLGYTVQYNSNSVVLHITASPHPGDLNCDGVVNFDDINPFVLALSDPAGYQQQYPNCNILNGDVNGDGRVDFADINPFVALLTGQ